MMLSVNVSPSRLKSKSNGNYVRIDINGKKGPNRFGYDVFFFPFYEKGLHLNYDKNTCDIKNYYTDMQHTNGWACSIWIMKKNNMKYKYDSVRSEW